MLLTFDERFSDSPFVERIWRSRSHSAGVFLSVASSHVEIAITRQNGRTFATVRGPETRATQADCAADGDWLGIRFTLGTFMPAFAPRDLTDRRDVSLPAASSCSFWLNGSAWEYPDFENADTFVDRLVRTGMLVHDSAVDTSLREPQGLAARSTQRHIQRHFQRHFLRAAGITRSTVRQIERARHATALLRQGRSILDTVYEAGYFDQAHLTRSLKALIGQTPLQIAQGTRQLSFLYKTTSASRIYDAHGRSLHDGIGTNRRSS